MDTVLGWLPVAAAVFAVPQFLPQLAGVWRTGDTAGVSWSWAALTSVSNGGWIAYFALSRLWTALVPAISATVLAGVLAALLARRGTVPRRPAAVTAGWAVLLAVAGTLAGGTGLGTVLTASFVLQVAPSLWAAYRTRRPTGISRGTLAARPRGTAELGRLRAARTRPAAGRAGLDRRGGQPAHAREDVSSGRPCGRRRRRTGAVWHGRRGSGRGGGRW